MSNEYFTGGDKPYAESLNDGILLTDVFNLSVPVILPDMFNNGNFVTDNLKHKAGVSTIKMENNTGITVASTSVTGTGSFFYRVYPNFNFFKWWKKIEWTATAGTVRVDVYDTNNNVIVSNITNGADLTAY